MADRVIQLPAHGWRPRPYQWPLWEYLRSGGKRAVLRWHRRSGKDEVLLHHTAYSAMERVGSYWYMLPEASQARKSMWAAINPKTGRRRIDDAFPLEMRSKTLEQEMMIEFVNGSTFQLVGSDNYNSLVGSPPIGLVFSEYALANPSAWAYLMPIVEENGGWAVFNSTPRGKNHFRDLCQFAEEREDWFYSLNAASDTGVFTNTQLLDILAQLQATHGEEYGMALWQQEYQVSFDAAMPGSIWGDCLTKLQAQGKIGAFPWVKGYPVHTGWDLGYDDDTAIWFYQVIGYEVRVIRYEAERFKDVPFYANLLKRLKDENGWEYGTHYLPHDARPRTLASGGKSILQQFEDLRGLGIGRFAIAKRLDVQEGIQAARGTFPRCSFDEKGCEKGLDALKSYRREWDDDLKVFSPTPKHDWASHGADAWRTVSVSWRFESQGRAPELGLEEGLLARNREQMTFGVAKKAFLNRKRLERLNH